MEMEMEEEMEVPLPQAENIKSILTEPWGRSVIYNPKEPELEENLSSTSEDTLKCVVPKEVEHSIAFLSSLPEVKPDVASLEEDDNASYKLNFFDSALMAVILETSITQMQILDRCNNALMVQKAEMEMDEMEGVRFGVPQTPESKIQRMHTLTAAEMAHDRFKLEKFESDRKMISDLLQQTFLELLEKRSFCELQRVLRRMTEDRQLVATTGTENAALKTYYKSLNQELRQRRAKQKTDMYDADVLAAEIEDKLEDAALNADIQCRYAERWEAARAEQAELAASRTEGRPSDSLELSKRGVDNEQRINAEIELVYSITIEESLKKIEDWMDKYEQDSEEIDLKLRMRKIDYQNTVDDRIALEKELEKRGKLMSDWVKFKTDRQTRLDWEAKMKKSAVSIQAWWRGLLVRKCLGPYKVKKGKKPGAKEDKKKKK